LAAGFIDAKSFTIDRIKQAFKHFDTNGNGKISFEEVMDFMD
jgi:Ca2+-binding EF-hand superfamily protein